MSAFRELVKQFDTIRSYVRDFYIYGFKSREDYTHKSGRTYDNERRRVESWFSSYIQSDYKHGKKTLAISVDSRRIAVNPLYAAWKSKSFTSNDIMLHFFLLDLLQDGEARSVEEITDEIQADYDILFDPQTVRKKLVEYEANGLLSLQKNGRLYLYRVNACLADEIPEERQALVDAVKFYQADAVFGFLGSTILDNQKAINDLFRMKHDFLVHTLEDEVLLRLLSAMQEQCIVKVQNQSNKSLQIQSISGTPLKIMVSTQTGRRYLCMYIQPKNRLATFRLDNIKNVRILKPDAEFAIHAAALEKNLPLCYGVSFGERHGWQTFSLLLYVDEAKEMHIVNRLEREGRGGSVSRMGKNQYLYEGTFFDVNEASPWIKTFTGRILSLKSSDPILERKFIRDMERMADMYLQKPAKINAAGEKERG